MMGDFHVLARKPHPNAVILLFRDHRSVQAFDFLVRPRIDNDARVEFQVFEEKLVHELRSGFFAPIFFESPLIEEARKLRLRDLPTSVLPQSALNDWEGVRIGLVGVVFLLAPFFGIAARVTDGRFPWEDALIDARDHSIHASLPTDGIVEFRASRQDGLDEFFRRVIADWLRYRVQRYAVLDEDFPHVKMVFGVAGESIHLGDHERSDLSFVFPTQFDSPEKFLAVGRFGRRTLFAKYLNDFDISVFAIISANLLLKVERGALDLLVARHASVNDPFHIFVPKKAAPATQYRRSRAVLSAEPPF